MTTSGHVQVVVDRLVLEGVPPDRVQEVVASFEQHLTAFASGEARVPVQPPPHARATVDDVAALGRHAAAEVWRNASGAIPPAGTER